MRQLTAKAVACALAAALIIVSPGLGCYEVLASAVAARAVSGVQGVPSGAAGAGLLGSAGVRSPAALLAPAAGLEGSLPLPAASLVKPVSAVRTAPAAGAVAAPVSGVPAGKAVVKLGAPVQGGRAVSPGAVVRPSSLRAPAVEVSVSPASQGRKAQAASLRKLLKDADLGSAAPKKLERASGESAFGVGARIMDRILGIVSGRKGAAASAAPEAESDSSSKVPALSPASAEVAGREEAEAPPVPEAESETESASSDVKHLIFDVHKLGFRAGYVDATIWKPGDALRQAPKRRRFGGRAARKEWKSYLDGLAYRIAELHSDEKKGFEFLERAEGLESVADLAAEYLRDSVIPAALLKENLADNDYVQGYLTTVGYRPAKQVLMPAASLLQRLNPRLRSVMRKRDARFLEGLKAGLREQHNEAAAAKLEEELKDAPKVGTQEFQNKLYFALKNTLAPSYNKELDKSLHFIPGKVKIPKSLLGLFWGHSIFIVFGIYMHMNAQPYLVYGLTGGSKTMMGLVRNIHFGAYSVSNFLPVGPVIDKTDYPVLFKGTSIVRALLMGAIPLLWMSGHLSFAVLALIVAINPIFQNLMTNSDVAASYSILGEEEAIVKEGNAFVNKWYAVAEVLMPLISGAMIGLLVRSFGDPGGYAMAYAVYAVMLLLAIPTFHFLVRDPRYHDPSVKKKPVKRYRNVFEAPYVAGKALFYLVKWTFLGGPVKLAWALTRGVFSTLGRIGRPLGLVSREASRKESWLSRRGRWASPIRATVRWLESPTIKKAAVTKDRSEMLKAADARNVDLEALWKERGMLAEEGDSVFRRFRKALSRIPSRGAEKTARFFDRIEATQGLSVIIRSKTLAILLSVHVIEYFLEDALFFVVLPNYLIDVIRPQASLAALSLLTPVLEGVPLLAWLGPLVDELLRALLSTKGGLTGAMLAVSALGGLLGTLYVSGPKGDLRIKRHGHSKFYKAAALGSLLFWLMMVPIAIIPPVVGGVAPAIPLPLFFASLGIYLFQNFMMRMLHEPLQTVLAPVRRNQIPNDMVGKVSAAMTMIQVAFTAAGALTVGLALDFVPIGTAVFWISVGITLTALLQWKAPKWLNKIKPKGWHG